MSIGALAVRLASARVSAKPVGLARIAIGTVAAISSVEAMASMTHTLQPGMMRYPYGGISTPLPSGAIIPIGIAWFVFSIAFAAGYATRLAGFSLTAIIAFVLSTDQRLFSNHFYLLAIVIFLLTLADSGAAHSIEARRRRRKATVPAWPLLMLKGQFAIVYAFAAIAKINREYLSGDVIASFSKIDRLSLLPDAISLTTIFMIVAWLSITNRNGAR